jgi:type II restriction enzyme
MEVDEDIRKTIALIDVLWFKRNTNKIVCAYEVEKSSSIYSGILRLKDLALTLPDSEKETFYLVAPDQREKELIAQLKRPSLITDTAVKISYILFSELCEHCDSICKLGDDHTIMEKVAKCVT